MDRFETSSILHVERGIQPVVPFVLIRQTALVPRRVAPLPKPNSAGVQCKHASAAPW